MLCCKKGNYSPNKKQNTSNDNSNVTLNSCKKKYKTNLNTFTSIKKKKKDSNDRKDSHTIQFKSNIK